MRKPLPAAFGTRGVVPVTVGGNAKTFAPRPKRLAPKAPTRYGMIINIAIVLWVLTLLAVMFWI
jgi:hypothetical protein